MLFSVIIPVHNAEQYIDRCLQSIFVNDFEDYEILAVENGSTDNSLAILNSYASEHPQIKVFSTSEKGVSNARNIGLDNATGDIITFVDIDDTVSENYFFEISNSFKAFPEIDALIFNHNDIVNGLPQPYQHLGNTRKSTGPEAVKLLLTTIGGNPWDKAVRRSKVGNTRFKGELFIAEDLEFETRLFYSLNLVFISNKEIYNYWINPNSAIQSIIIKGTMRFAINPATKNLIYSYKCISDFFLNAESSQGEIAQTALAIYTDNLATFLVSAFIEKTAEIADEYFQEFDRVKRLSLSTLKKDHPQKYVRVKLISLLIKSRLFRPLASALIRLNDKVRYMKKKKTHSKL